MHAILSVRGPQHPPTVLQDHQYRSRKTQSWATTISRGKTGGPAFRLNSGPAEQQNGSRNASLELIRSSRVYWQDDGEALEKEW